MWPKIGHFGRYVGGRGHGRHAISVCRWSLETSHRQRCAQFGRTGASAATKITLTQLWLLAFAGSGVETGSVVHWSHMTTAGDAAGETFAPHMPVDMAALGLQVRTLRNGPSVRDGACRRVGAIP